MTQAAFGGTIFNSTVDLWLETERGKVPLSQAGTAFVIAVDAIEIPAGALASLVVSIDGDEHHRKVLLPQGMRHGRPKTGIVSCDDEGLPF